MSYPDNGPKRAGDIVMNVHPYSVGRYPLGRVEHVDTYRRSTDGSTVHDIRVRTGPGSTVHSSAESWTVVTLHDENQRARHHEDRDHGGGRVMNGPRKTTKIVHCEHHAPWFATCGTRARVIECMVEGGPGGWETGCEGGKCELHPGTNDRFLPELCYGPYDLTEWTEHA